MSRAESAAALPAQPVTAVVTAAPPMSRARPSIPALLPAPPALPSLASSAAGAPWQLRQSQVASFATRTTMAAWAHQPLPPPQQQQPIIHVTQAQPLHPPAARAAMLTNQPSAAVQRDSKFAIQLQEAQSRITQLTAELAQEKQLSTQRLLAARRDEAAASFARESALLGKRTAEAQLHTANKRLRASEEMVVALQDAKACVACTVQLRCMAFVPCGHLALCADCAVQVQHCPICPQPDADDKPRRRGRAKKKMVAPIKIINS